MTDDAADPAQSAGHLSVSASGPRPLTPADLPAGTVIDKYRLGEVLGRGGMGLVVAAEHVQLREQVALKFLRVEGDTSKSFRSRFRREAQICATIKNEHITRVIDIGTYQDADFMVMERLTGSDLRGFLRQQQTALSIADAVDLAVQACQGLAEVHARGVVHRDLKPSNLFVTKRYDGSRLLKILDFGISKWASEMDDEEEELTKTGAVLGSPKYMAPEQLFGSSTVDARADVWSIGAILYELLVGKPPFEEATFARLCARISSGQPPLRPRERRPEVSEELDVAVMLCLEPNVAERLPNVAVVAGELLAAIGDSRAESVRERLQATLDGGSLSSSGSQPSMRSGHYVAASLTLSRTGSGSSSSTRAPAAIDAPAPAPEQRGRGKLVVVLLVAALTAVALFFVLRREPSPPAAANVATPSTSSSASTAEVATPAVASTSTTPVAVAPPVSVSVSASVTAPLKQPVVFVKPGVKPVKTAEPAPTPTAAPTPAPVVKEPPKPTNPLEDRQ